MTPTIIIIKYKPCVWEGWGGSGGNNNCEEDEQVASSTYHSLYMGATVDIKLSILVLRRSLLHVVHKHDTIPPDCVTSLWRSFSDYNVYDTALL